MERGFGANKQALDVEPEFWIDHHVKFNVNELSRLLFEACISWWYVACIAYRGQSISEHVAKACGSNELMNCHQDLG